jgi:hypothetical protein
VAAADIIPRQLVSVMDWIRCCCEARDQAEGGHFEHLLYSTFSALTSLHHMNKKVLKKKYSEVMSEKCYKEQNLLSFIANKEINWHVS